MTHNEESNVWAVFVFAAFLLVGGIVYECYFGEAPLPMEGNHQWIGKSIQASQDGRPPNPATGPHGYLND